MTLETATNLVVFFSFPLLPLRLDKAAADLLDAEVALVGGEQRRPVGAADAVRIAQHRGDLFGDPDGGASALWTSSW